MIGRCFRFSGCIGCFAGAIGEVERRRWRGSFSVLLRKRPYGSSGEAASQQLRKFRGCFAAVESAPVARLRSCFAAVERLGRRGAPRNYSKFYTEFHRNKNDEMFRETSTGCQIFVKTNKFVVYNNTDSSGLQDFATPSFLLYNFGLNL